MSDRERPRSRTPAPDHEGAATAFAERARTRYADDLAALYVFGSTARGEATGLGSDVDVLVVLADDADQQSIADGLRDVAYDVMLEYGPVVEVHVLTESAFQRARDDADPFVRNVLHEGRAYA